MGGQGTRKDMVLFGDLIRGLHLVDLPLLGRSFTWSNKRDSPSFAQLDRFLVSTEWIGLFPMSGQSALSAISSDHVAILLDSGSSLPRRKNFRFEKMWSDHPSFDSLVALWWGQEEEKENPVLNFVG